MSLPSLGVRFRAGAAGSASAVVALAPSVEAAGADALFVDGVRPPGSAFDPDVVLGAVAAVTSRLTLGCIASRVDERHPSLVARSVASLDVCSGARALACLAPALVAGDDQLGELAEALAVVRSMLDVRGASFSGTHFSIATAWNEPRAERTERLPLGVLATGDESPTGGRARLITAELLVALSAHVDFVVTDHLAAPLQTAPEQVQFALIGVDSERSVVEIADELAAVSDSGFGGVILDWSAFPERGRLEEIVGAAATRLAAAS